MAVALAAASTVSASQWQAAAACTVSCIHSVARSKEDRGEEDVRTHRTNVYRLAWLWVPLTGSCTTMSSASWRRRMTLKTCPQLSTWWTTCTWRPKNKHLFAVILSCDIHYCRLPHVTSLGNSGLCWTVFARNRDTAVPAEGNGNLQTLICVLVVRPRRCLTLSNSVRWQNWMVAYLGYTLRMRTLFRGWPIMVNDTHTRRRRSRLHVFTFRLCTVHALLW